MAVLVTSNMTELYDADIVTGWSPAPGTNSVDKLEGSNCLADQAKSTTGSVFLHTLASAIDMSDKFIVATMKVNGVADTKALGGYRIILEDSGANRATWYVGGNDTHPGGWGYFAIDPSTSPESGSVDETDILKIGVQFKTLTSVVGTADNCFWDIAHYGTGITVTSAAAETGGSGISGAVGWEDLYDASAAAFDGIVQKLNGVYFTRGKLIFGNSASTLSIDFDDLALIGVLPDPHMTDNVSGIDILGNATGSSNVIMGNSVIFSSVRKWEFDISDTDIDAGELPSSTIQKTAASDISAGEYIGTIFDSCEQLTPGAAVMTGCVVKNSPSTSAALLYPTTDNMSAVQFISVGTGHAILINTVGTYTFDAHLFDGYASVDGSTGNECVYNNSGGAVTINITGGDTPTIRNGTSATTTLVVNPVDFDINIKTLAAGTNIENVRILVWVSDGSNFPYQDVVTIVSSGTTATVTHAAHGLVTGDFIKIENANEDSYNGTYAITYISSTSYSYTMGEADTTPATGTILATFAYFNSLTNASGDVSDTRSIAVNQPVLGWARKMTGSPIYQQGVVSGTVDKDSGLSLNIQLAGDE